MRRWALGSGTNFVNVKHNFRRLIASPLRTIGRARLVALVLCGTALTAGGDLALAQTDQQIRCMQLQQDLTAAQGGGGGANSADLARIDQQIAAADRVFQGTQAAMDDAGCFQSFFIFGRGLVRNPQCLKMNDRVEDARRQLSQLQEQRQALTGGGGNRRRQAELQDALARAGCGGQPRQTARRGGLFDIFGGGQEEEVQDIPQTPIYRSIDPNGRYRSVCVRLCDGFFYPISYATYAIQLAQEAQQCQSSCAAPAELYVYRNPGQEIEQAISLNGSAYMDLPVALRFRKEYVQGCSCKQAEYNPTDIEAANKRAEAEAASQPAKGKGKGKVAAKPPAPPPAGQTVAPAAGPASQPTPQLDLDVTGSNPPANPVPAAAAAQSAPPAQKVPAPPPAASSAPPAASASAAPTGEPAAGSSSIIKKTAKPAAAPTAQ